MSAANDNPAPYAYTPETLGCLDRAVSEIVNGTAALYGREG